MIVEIYCHGTVVDRLRHRYSIPLCLISFAYKLSWRGTGTSASAAILEDPRDRCDDESSVL